jgi:hypothetical protein
LDVGKIKTTAIPRPRLTKQSRILTRITKLRERLAQARDTQQALVSQQAYFIYLVGK